MESEHALVVLQPLQGHNWTGLILASRRGNLHIVRQLLDRGAEVNQLTDVSG